MAQRDIARRSGGKGAGNLYAETTSGSVSAGTYLGTVFKISPDGTETVLHYFTNAVGGAFPRGPLLADSFGNLYGTALGMVFKTSGSGFVFSPAAALAERSQQENDQQIVGRTISL